MSKRKRNMVPVFKALALLAGIAAALLFTVAMANIGMANMDEWYYDNGGQRVEGGTGQGSAGLVPCTDDSAPNYPCSWDSNTQGNGEGESFWVDEYGVTHTWQDA